MLTPEEWLTELDNAKEYRRIYGREDAWEKNEMNYFNDPLSDCRVGPNLVFSMGDSLLSSLVVPDPEITVTAERMAGVDRAPIVESIDNWLIRKLKMKKHCDLALLNAFLYGPAIIKIGYDSEFGWSPYYDVGADNNLFGMTFTQFDKKGERIEYKNTTPGMPWIGVVSPHDFLVPWGTLLVDDAPWVAYRFIRENKYLKKDPKYIHTARLEAQMSMEDFIASYGNIGSKRGRYRTSRPLTKQQNRKLEFNECWEIHDRMSGRIFVITDDYDKFLRNDLNALRVCNVPFVAESFVPHPRSFWSTPLAYYLGQIQSEQFDISLQNAKQRRLNVAKFIASKNLMSNDEMEKLVSGGVGAFAMSDTTRSLKDSVVPFPQVQNWDLSMQSENNRRDAREAIGFGRNQIGDEMQSSRRTAREVSSVEKGSERRMGKRSSVIIDLYTGIISKMNQIIFTFWNSPRSVQVGPDWKQFTGEEISGEFLYDVSLSSKRNLSRAQRKVEALMLFMQFAQMGMVNPQMFQYIIDAANDPAFEKLIAPMTGGKGQQSAQAEGGGK